MSSCILYFDSVKVSQCVEFSFVGLAHTTHYTVVDMMNYQDATNNFYYKHSTLHQEGPLIVKRMKIFRDDVMATVKRDVLDHQTIFTYGKTNARILSRVLNRHVVDLQDLHCPPLNVLKIGEEDLNTHTTANLLGVWWRSNRSRTDLSKFEARLKTFETFPHKNVSFDELAKTGLYYMFELDRTVCVYCHIVLEEWKIDDCPAEEHKRWNRRCPFLRDLPVGTHRPERTCWC